MVRENVGGLPGIVPVFRGSHFWFCPGQKSDWEHLLWKYKIPVQERALVRFGELAFGNGDGA